MAAILNSAILNSFSSSWQNWQTDSSWLKNTSASHSTWWWQPSWILPTWIPPYWIQPSKFFLSNSLTLANINSPTKIFTHSFWINLMMASILNSAILDSAILHKINFTHSFWLNLMITAILNSAMLDSDTAILDSDTLLSFLRFTPKHPHSNLTLTQTNSIWLKLIHSHLTWWRQPSWILPSWIPPYWIQPS